MQALSFTNFWRENSVFVKVKKNKNNYISFHIAICYRFNKVSNRFGDTLGMLRYKNILSNLRISSYKCE